MKIRCFLFGHQYRDADMVVRLAGETDCAWQFAVKRRCIYCGRLIEDVLEINKPV